MKSFVARIPRDVRERVVSTSDWQVGPHSGGALRTKDGYCPLGLCLAYSGEALVRGVSVKAPSSIEALSLWVDMGWLDDQAADLTSHYNMFSEIFEFAHGWDSGKIKPEDLAEWFI